MHYHFLTPDEAALLITDGEVVGFSGFTAAGSVKALPEAIARRAQAEHEAGRPFRVKMLTGASAGSEVDGPMADADAVSLRIPYQSSVRMRAAINSGRVAYHDMHLSMVAQALRMGYLPRVTTAIIEVCDVTDEGELTLTASQGNSVVFCELADRIILEWNTYHRPEIKELHDVYSLQNPPHRVSIPIHSPEDRIGSKTLKVDPAKIIGIVRTHQADHLPPYKEGTEATDRIGEHLAEFLAQECAAGGMKDAAFLPVQSGVGNIANAALKAIGRAQNIPPIKMYTEVLQDSALDLIRSGRCLFASSCSLSVSDEVMEEIYERFDYYRDRILLRPAEISNHPEVARRLGLICMNAAIEADIFGNVNSTHVCGSKIMNGIGGSGDFARSAAVSIFMCPSVAKGGAISAIVPMVTHTDHPEHDVDVLVTEQGIADLRGKSPRERAAAVIENCAHPDYRPLLRRYVELTPVGHTPHCLEKAFAFHLAFMQKGDMRMAEL